MRKVAFLTLGCKVNQADSGAMEQLFRQAGYLAVDFTEPADVYIINTCVVTDTAEHKSRQLIRRAARQNPNAVIAVTGCYPQIGAEAVKHIKGVDLIVGTDRRREIVSLVEKARQSGCLDAAGALSLDAGFEELPSGNVNTRTRAYLKIQEGCDQYCSYCVIPYARGPSRSRPLESVRTQTSRLVEAGFREIVLIGIHLGAYGAEKPAAGNLCAAVKTALSVDNLERLRLGSIEPTELDFELLSLLKNDRRLCRHLHLPLQSGCDAVLRAMKRPYGTADFQRIVDEVRCCVPDVAITTDIIAGFPGETPAMFAETCAFVEKMAFSRAHIFPFSPRAGTPAADFSGQVGREEKIARTKELARIAKKSEEKFLSGLLGKEREVLFEQAEGETLMTGLTDDYAKAFAPLDNSLLGGIARVLITGLEAGGVTAKLAMTAAKIPTNMRL
ncbi:MAG: tRNA (N(6)-L-threonylcarbamoyladenosine(37)-C(2))-methylthiotransferase MtaB [Acidaminococcales bacterium]|jgi:threonylcarbamoyladenosine tRNA methylthiotransferase MtaB|nr:tRNA (N(6)-L-threonylcarbamoyladenosine(37)-C(2))-methylthiotransferase MtaB [Acidaminococcales bacterium]